MDYYHFTFYDHPGAEPHVRVAAVSEARPFGSGQEPSNASAGEGSAFGKPAAHNEP